MQPFFIPNIRASIVPEIMELSSFVLDSYTVNFCRTIIGRLVVNPMYFLYIGSSYKMATFIS